MKNQKKTDTIVESEEYEDIENPEYDDEVLKKNFYNYLSTLEENEKKPGPVIKATEKTNSEEQKEPSRKKPLVKKIKNYLFGEKDAAGDKESKKSYAFVTNSSFGRGVIRCIGRVTGMPSKAFGSFLVAYALLCLIFYLSTVIINRSFIEENLQYFTLGILALTFSILFIGSDNTVEYEFKHNRLLLAIFVNFLGYRLADTENEKNEKKEEKGKSFVFAGLIAGLAAGALNIFIPPKYVWLSVFSVILFFATLSSPEVGFNLAILILPFTTSLDHRTLPVAALAVICTVSLVRKVLLKKRKPQISVIDLLIILFALLFFFSGVTATDGNGDIKSALLQLALPLGYFLASNLLKSDRSVVCTEKVTAVAAFAVSLVAILQYASVKTGFELHDFAFLRMDSGEINSVFENKEIMLAFLIFALPLVISAFISYKGYKCIFPFIVFAVSFFTVIVSEKLTAYVALFAVTVLMLLYTLNAKIAKVTVFSLGILPMLLTLILYLFSENLGAAFPSLLSDISNLEGIWKNTFKIISDHFAIGVGGSPSAFTNAYKEYYNENVSQPYNIFISIFAEAGLFALALFVAVGFVFVKENFPRFSNPDNKRYPTLQIAAVLSVYAMLILGVTDSLWYDRRTVFIFFSALGIAKSAGKQAYGFEILPTFDTAKEENRLEETL